MCLFRSDFRCSCEDYCVDFILLTEVVLWNYPSDGSWAWAIAGVAAVSVCCPSVRQIFELIERQLSLDEVKLLMFFGLFTIGFMFFVHSNTH